MLVRDFRGGLNTRLDPTLVPPDSAVEMDNATPFSGVLKSERGTALVRDENGDTLAVDDSFYNFKGDWVSGPNRDYVEYRDRLYYTDGANPRVLLSGDNPRNLDETDAEAVRQGLVRPTVALDAIWEPNNPMLIERGRSHYFRYTLYDDSQDIESPPSDVFELEAIDTVAGSDVSLVRLVLTATNNPKYTESQGTTRKGTNPPTLPANAPGNTTNISHVILYILQGTRYVEYQRKILGTGAVTLHFNQYSFNVTQNNMTSPRIGPRISESDISIEEVNPAEDVEINNLGQFIIVNGSLSEVLNKYVFFGQIGNVRIFRYTYNASTISVLPLTLTFEWYNLPSGAKSSQTTVTVNFPEIEVTMNSGVTSAYRVRINTPNIRRHGQISNPFITHLAVSTNVVTEAGAVSGVPNLTATALTNALGYTPFDFIPLTISEPADVINVKYSYPVNKPRGQEDRAEGDVRPPRADAPILISVRNEPCPSELINLTEAYTILMGSVGEELRFSIPDNPNAWPLENSITFPETITGIFPIPAGILVFSRNSTFLIKGTSVRDFRRVLISNTEGCLHHRTCQLVKRSPIWLSNSGLCTFVNGYVEVISQPYLANVHKPSAGHLFSSAVFDERYFVLIVKDNGSRAVLVADFRDKMSFYTLTGGVDNNLAGLRYHDGSLYGSVETVGTTRKDLVEFFKGDFLRLTYTSPSFTEGDHSMLKTYAGIYLRSKGRLSVTINMDGVTAKNILVEGDKTHDIKIPPQHQRGYALSVTLQASEVSGADNRPEETVIYSIESRPQGRLNGR